MEMEFQDTSSRRRRLLLILGVVLAVLAGYSAFSLSQNSDDSEAPPTRSVVTAAHGIAARTVLQAADLQLTEVPDVPSNATAFGDIDSLVGQVTTVPVSDGQIVFPNVLVTAAEGAPFSILGPGDEVTPDSPYWRAVSVMVPRDRAVGGEILSGQRVDLFVTVQIDVLVQNEEGEYENVPSSDGMTSGKSTKVIFQDLEVLDAKPDDDMYVLKVDARQAEEISHVATVAPTSFSLALRPDGDTRIADTTDFGETNDRLIVQYLFPVPRLIDLEGQPGPVEPQPGPITSPPDDVASPAPETSPTAEDSATLEPAASR